MKHRLNVLALLLLLAACGFSPIYGNHGGGKPAVVDSLSVVYIDGIGGQYGQFLRNKLMDRFYYHGRPEKPQAFLSVSIQSSESGLGIQKDATTSRSQLELTASFVLKDDMNNTLLKGAARSIASYGKLDAQYGTLATQRNAYERALNEVSEQITARLSLYYAEYDPAAAKKPLSPKP